MDEEKYLVELFQCTLEQYLNRFQKDNSNDSEESLSDKEKSKTDTKENNK